MNKSVGRPKLQYDVEEVKEIINLKLHSIDYDYSKFTYNSVHKFNQYLVSAKKKNIHGTIFTNYGYSFWATEYKGVPNYGKDQIDLYKQSVSPIIAGENLVSNTIDIETIIDNNMNNPKKMRKLLVKIFSNERKSNAHNDKQFYEMQTQLKEYQKLVLTYRELICSLFFNSQFSCNNLPNLMQYSSKDIRYVYDEVLNIFNLQDKDLEHMCLQGNNSLHDLDVELNENILELAKYIDSSK